LRNRFSIVPEARGLVTTGPYHFVRHPIYLGEIIAGFGLVLPTVLSLHLLVFCIFLGAQVARTYFEERMMRTGYPTYEASAPRTDLYTYTVAGHRWITHEWLSEVVLAALYAVGRLPLESLVLGALTWAGFFLVYRAIDRRVNFVIAGLALALGVAAANPIWGP